MSKRFAVIFLLIYFLTGVFIAPVFVFKLEIIAIAFFLLLMLVFIFRRRREVLVFGLAAIFLLAGFSRFHLNSIVSLASDTFEATGYDSEITARGYILSYPQEKEKNQTFYFRAEKIISTKTTLDVNSNIFILTSKLREYSYGQELVIRGRLERIENTDEFNYKDFFIAKGVTSKILAPKIEITGEEKGNYFIGQLFGVRRWFDEKVRSVFQEPFSSFVNGFLLGVKSLPNDLSDMFSQVSLSHIIVVSGYNLSIIVNLLKNILGRKSRKWAFWVPLTGISFFVLITGAEAPVVRAAIMAFIILLASHKGRKADSLLALLLAAFVMVLFNPYLLRFDPGFQLSFLSTAGIIMFSSKLETWIAALKIPSFASEVMASTLSAQFFIMPVILYYFERLSVFGAIVNFVVLPFVPLIMLVSFVAVLVSIFSTFVGYLLSLPSILMMLFVIKVAALFSSYSFSSLEFKVPLWLIPVFYAAMLFLYQKVKVKNV